MKPPFRFAFSPGTRLRGCVLSRKIKGRKTIGGTASRGGRDQEDGAVCGSEVGVEGEEEESEGRSRDGSWHRSTEWRSKSKERFGGFERDMT